LTELLLCFASVFGVALGPASKGITKNFISGLIIIFERRIEVVISLKSAHSQGLVPHGNPACAAPPVVTLIDWRSCVSQLRILESQW